jgi:hypothetical protein
MVKLDQISSAVRRYCMNTLKFLLGKVFLFAYFTDKILLYQAFISIHATTPCSYAK